MILEPAMNLEEFSSLEALAMKEFACPWVQDLGMITGRGLDRTL